MKLKLRDYKDILLENKFQEGEKRQFREDIRNFGRFGEHIYNGRGMKEVVEAVKHLAEQAQAHALDEAGNEGWFESVTVKKNMGEVKKNAQLFEKTANEMGALQQRMEALYEDMAHSIGRYYEVGELAGKDVMPADNDYTANGEQPEEENDDEQAPYQLTHAVSHEGIDDDVDEQFLPGDYYDTRSAKPKKVSHEGMEEQGHPQLPKGTHVWGMGDLQDDDVYENFSMNTGNKNLPGPGNAGGTGPTDPGAPGQDALSAGSNPQGPTMPLGDLMSPDEIAGVKENYWTLQGAQKSLMEDEADEDTPGMADINQSTGWKARNESRANFFSRMKDTLETL
jgi:hypothetical protein